MTGVAFLTKRTYKIRIKIGFTKTVLHPKTGMIDFEAGPNLIYEDYLKPQ